MMEEKQGSMRQQDVFPGCVELRQKGSEVGELDQTVPIRPVSLPVESELDPLRNGKLLEACKEHEQICKLEMQ